MQLWEPNQNFTDGEFCAARQLDAICNNLAYLHSWASMPNMPFSGEEHHHAGDVAASWRNAWVGHIRHKKNWVRVDIQIKSDSFKTATVELLYNDIVIGTAQSSNNEWVSMTGSIDISGQSFAVGTHYPLRVRHKSTENYYPSDCRVFFIYESEIDLPDGSGTWRMPDKWSHLDPGRGTTTDEYPQFYTFSKDLLWLKSHLHSANWGIRDVDQVEDDDSFGGFGIVHRMRWLHYLGEGTIVFGKHSHGFADADPDNPKTVWGIFDLESLNWLPYGVLYYVQSERPSHSLVVVHEDALL